MVAIGTVRVTVYMKNLLYVKEYVYSLCRYIACLEESCTPLSSANWLDSRGRYFKKDEKSHNLKSKYDMTVRAALCVTCVQMTEL